MRHKIIPMLLATALLASPALADKGGKGHGNGNGNSHGNGDSQINKHEGGESHVIIDKSDRVVIREYISQDYHRSCPPGLAKKNNGCLPPGQAKKHYVIGQPLAYGIWQPVPHSLLVQLHPVPQGYEYVMVDRDVLLISAATHHVVDAITLMSAVGH